MKFTPEERSFAVERLREDDITSCFGTGPVVSHSRALLNAITDWRIYLLCLGYMTIVGTMALCYFYPTMIAGLGYTATKAQFMTAPLFLAAFVIAIPLCIFADRVPPYRPVFVAVLLILGAIFCALAAGVQSYTPRYIFLCLINSAIWAANPLALSFASTTLGAVDPETRAIGLALVNGMGNLAQVYGAYLWPSRDAPGYIMGFSVFAGMLVIGCGVYLASFWALNKHPFTNKPTTNSEMRI